MFNKIVPLVLLLLLTLPAASLAGQAFVPQTGQATCYDSAGGVIPCAGTGQSGDQPPGMPWPDPRFIDNGNGTVTDNLTGLTWLKNANCFGGKSWSGALTAANTLASGACGLTDGSVVGDWRLPNITELYSLINWEQVSTATSLMKVGFSNVMSGSGDEYWSSTQYYSFDGWSLAMKFHDNTTWSTPPGITSYFVWPVRGGQ